MNSLESLHDIRDVYDRLGLRPGIDDKGPEDGGPFIPSHFTEDEGNEEDQTITGYAEFNPQTGELTFHDLTPENNQDTLDAG